MDKKIVFLLIFFGGFQGCSGKEKKCSKLDFQEKVLEKLVRIEHKMEMTESSHELSLQVKEDIQKMKADLANMSGNTQENLTEIKKDLEILKGELVEREKVLNDTIKMKITELSAKIPKSAYAFSAHDLSASTPSAGDTLVFAQTMLNEDGVYSTTTGKFTAPCDGVYEFHATLVPSQANKGARIAFEADGIAIGNLNVYDNPEPVGSSYSVIARLQERTQVYLNVTAVETGFRFYEATKRMNTFSGHLISY